MKRILHQLGHRYQWSLSSIETDDTGDGVIIGPRYMSPEKVREIPLDVRTQSLFDPQFFLPHSAIGKLREYSFFPEILAGGFSTTEWTPNTSIDCAKKCIEFQNSIDLNALIIPTRFYEGMPSDFISNQESQFVVPFLESISQLGDSHQSYLQLILTDQMIKDSSYRTSLLNWATSYPELSGIYLLVHVNNRMKQLCDIDLLLALLNFIAALKTAGMSVIIGYTNTESILLLCSEPDAVTMGSYENLRMFNLRSFREQKSSIIRGPHARIYIPRLLAWVQYQYIGAIERVVDNLDDYIGEDSYRMRMFKPTYNWHFTKSEPYMHYFKTFASQYKHLSSSSGSALLDNVLNVCKQAQNEFAALRDSGVVFPAGSGGEHLASWITVLNLWRREVGL